jgi:hypothetical protein
MSYGPFPAWDEEETYSTGERVSYDGYIYEAMTSIAAGDNPRSATYSLLGGTFRKWKVWDYPASYIMARLRRLPGESEISLPNEVRTICVRTDFVATDAGYENDVYHGPDSLSPSGYGMPRGMNSNWSPPESGSELMYSFSAVPYEDGKPKTYEYGFGADTGIVYQPTTIAPYMSLVETDDDPPEYVYALNPAWATETQGQMISCYQTFSRSFQYFDGDGAPSSTTTTGFQDNWTADPTTTVDGEYILGGIVGTEPNYQGT